jgi:ferritin-like metal-binding protein YciE
VLWLLLICIDDDWHWFGRYFTSITLKKNTMKTTNSKSQPKKAVKKATKQGESEVADGLRELFVAELKDIYWAENALLKAIPKMIKNASSEELISALEDHLSVTEEQVSRLDQVFEIIEVKAQGKKCEAMAGLIKEAEEIMKDTKKGDVRDAGIISAAQKVEHYEIASYGTLRTFALTLEEYDAADLLEETLQEEKDADQSLTEIAEASINAEAV